jgi:hypothetical protein
MTVDKRRERAREWIDTIYSEVQNTVVDNHIFWEVQRIRSSNPRLSETGSVFWQWMIQAFAHSTAIAIRRQVKKDDQSVSLHRLLAEMRDFPDVFDRAYFVSLYRPELRSRGNVQFDRLAGDGAPDLRQAAGRDIEELSRQTHTAEYYADRRVAHYDSRGLDRGAPTFDDLKSAVTCLGGLVKKYRFALKSETVLDLMPALPDWTHIFTFPWIDNSQTVV